MKKQFLRPPLKWLGSKLSQASKIIEEFPSHADLNGRYIEPFVGGGSIWLRYDATENVINDKDKDLMFFWSMNETEFALFKEIIISIESARTKGGCAIDDFKVQAMQAVRELHPSIDVSTANKIILQEYTRRLNALTKHNVAEDDFFEIRKITNTGVNAVIYYLCRHAWNKSGPEQTVVKTALWFVIRELAYSGIFRMNPFGEMNMSYGGVTYDAKDIMSKIEILEKVRRSDIYDRTRFYCEDFREFFNNINPNKDDFIFIDPPFAGNLFSMELHRELADIVHNLDSKVIITARDSDESIINLYPDLNRVDCDKTGTGVSILGRTRKRNKLILLKNW